MEVPRIAEFKAMCKTAGDRKLTERPKNASSVQIVIGGNGAREMIALRSRRCKPSVLQKHLFLSFPCQALGIQSWADS